MKNLFENVCYRNIYDEKQGNVILLSKQLAVNKLAEGFLKKCLTENRCDLRLKSKMYLKLFINKKNVIN